MQNLLILGSQLTLYIGPLPDVGQHRHSASALCAGLHAPIQARETAAAPWQDYQTLFVPAGVEHALSFGGQAVAVLFFEEQSRIFRDFSARYGMSKTSLSAPCEIPADWVAVLDACRRSDPDDGDEMLGKIVHRLLPGSAISRPIDPRVQKILALMQAQPERNFAAKELANHVCLSPGRLSAVFAENVGLPLRRYRVWLRLRSIVGFLSRGLSLTDAALMAGFSDSAHFSNSCRKLLGIKPTDVLTNDGSLRILLSAHL